MEIVLLQKVKKNKIKISTKATIFPVAVVLPQVNIWEAKQKRIMDDLTFLFTVVECFALKTKPVNLIYLLSATKQIVSFHF